MASGILGKKRLTFDSQDRLGQTGLELFQPPYREQPIIKFSPDLIKAGAVVGLCG